VSSAHHRIFVVQKEKIAMGKTAKEKKKCQSITRWMALKSSKVGIIMTAVALSRLKFQQINKYTIS
jgi:hypothetical protein